MTTAQPGQEQRMVTDDQIVEFVQDKLDNDSLTDGWWDNFDQEFRALLANRCEVERNRTLCELCGSTHDRRQSCERAAARPTADLGARFPK